MLLHSHKMYILCCLLGKFPVPIFIQLLKMIFQLKYILLLNNILLDSAVLRRDQGVMKRINDLSSMLLEQYRITWSTPRSYSEEDPFILVPSSLQYV